MTVTVVPVTGIPEVRAGDDVAELVFEHAPPLEDGDVVVVAHKVVSKAEGRVVTGVDHRTAAARESVRVLRRAPGGMTIAETSHGFVCANAGVDSSNVPGDAVALLPRDPDLSARRVREGLRRLSGVTVGVVVADTFGRAWRVGQTNVAVGVAGFDPFADYRGRRDDFGAELTATRICVADEIAGAAELVMRKAARVPAAVVRGVAVTAGRHSARAIVRPPEEDLFR